MTEYYDEAYFCIYKDPVVFAQNCGDPIGTMAGPVGEAMIDLPTATPPITPSIPEPSSVILMIVGVLAICVFRFLKR